MTFRPLAPARRRGQPLVVLAAVMLCWVGVRANAWRTELSRAAVPPPGLVPVAPPVAPHIATAVPPGPEQTALAIGAASPRPRRVTPLFQTAPRPGLAMPPLPSATDWPTREVAAVSLTAAPFPPPPFSTPGFAAAPAGPDRPAARRWSADAWTLIRSGGGVGSAGPSAATYGASQVGAVLRYRLSPSDPHRPTAYLRVSAALNGSGEREAAMGLSVRPIATLPVFVAGEGRVSRLSGRTVVRPAVMAVTELAPLALPQGARAEFYLQGGYVGGHGATPFIDGQLRIDREVARVGGVEARVGAGAWGGAQQGARRLDLGPSATLQVAQGPVSLRLGFDWRFRLAGSAAPASGPALTISAGF